MSKYDERRIWMKTGAEEKLKNLADTDAAVKRTKMIYAQAAKDIEAEVDYMYRLIKYNATAQKWDISALKAPATRKDIAALTKAVEKAGLQDKLPEAITNRMSVLQARQLNNYLHIHNAGQRAQETTKQALLKGLQGSNIWKAAEQAGAASFVGFDRNICGYMMGMNWAGGNFSTRLWNASEEAWQEVKDELTRALANGQSQETTKNRIRRILKESHRADAKGSGGLDYDVERIIRTEMAKASTEADIDRWLSMGVTKVQWNASFEKNTCEHCGERDGRIYELDKLLDVIPLHPNCRCYFTPYDEVAEAVSERTAEYKDSNGKYKTIAWAPFNAVFEPTKGGMKLRAERLKVSDFFFNASPWTQYIAPKTGLVYKGEQNAEFRDLAERTIGEIQEIYPEVKQQLQEDHGGEVYLHRGNSVVDAKRLKTIGGHVDTRQNPNTLLLTYPSGITGKTLKEIQEQAINSYKMGQWSTDKVQHTIIHELGHVLENNLRARGADIDGIIMQATGSRSLKSALKKIDKISSYGKKNSSEAFAELFARAQAHDPKLNNKMVADFTTALTEARQKYPQTAKAKTTTKATTGISVKNQETTPRNTTEQGWLRSLTKDERESIKAYANDDATVGYGDINNTLRRGEYKKGYKAPSKDGFVKFADERNDQVSKAVENIDKAIEKFTLAKDKTVWRGLSSSQMSLDFEAKLNALKPGSILSDKAYTSTAVTKSGTAEFGYSFMLKIKVPAGTGRGIYTRKLSEFTQENELLLKRDAQFKVTKVGTTTNAYGDKVKLLELEMLP